MTRLEKGLAIIDSSKDEFPMLHRQLADLLKDVSHATVNRHAIMIGLTSTSGWARPFTQDEARAIWQSICSVRHGRKAKYPSGYKRIMFTLSLDDYAFLLRVSATRGDCPVTWIVQNWVKSIIKKKREKQPLF